MDSFQICNRFTDYFLQHNFDFMPRAPLVHPRIPMSFVMSAGLIQVESAMQDIPEHITETVLVQDCFRHFDLHRVGKDITHLSLFKMPGAFLLGNNRKAEAISLVWNLVTTVYEIDVSRVWVTYFGGEQYKGTWLAEDTETREIWLALGLPPSQLIKGSIEHNYWIQGNGGVTEPDILRHCGPTTELFYSLHTPPRAPIGMPSVQNGYIEFANNLFISQIYDPVTNRFAAIDSPFTEIVIGVERTAMLLQRKETVFEIDLFEPILDTIGRHTQKNFDKKSFAWVIADHVRALFLLIDHGAPPPGKNGRERIVKQIIRRLVTYNHLLGIDDFELLDDIIQVVAESFDVVFDAGNTYEKLLCYFDYESNRFNKTLIRGHQRFEQLLSDHKGTTITATDALYLVKDWGYPVELIKNHLSDLGLGFPDAEYQLLLQLGSKVHKTS